MSDISDTSRLEFVVEMIEDIEYIINDHSKATVGMKILLLTQISLKSHQKGRTP